MRSKIARDLAVAYVSGGHALINDLDPVPEDLDDAVAALRCGMAMARGEATHDELLQCIRRALAGPIDDHLALVLRRVHLTLLAYKGQIDAALEDLRELEQIKLTNPPPELATIPFIARWRLQRLTGDDNAALATLTKYDLTQVSPGSRVWCDLHISQYQSCLESWNFRRAQDLLTAMDHQKGDLQAYGLAPRPLLALVLAIESADYRSAEAVMDRLITEHRRANPGMIAEYQLHLDLAAGRAEVVRQRLTAWLADEPDPSLGLMRFQLEQTAGLALMCEAEMALGNYAAAQDCLDRIEPSSIPRIRRQVAMIQAELYLNTAANDRAAALLDQWPQPDQWLPSAGPHIRLAMQRNDWERAARYAEWVVSAGGWPLLLRCLRFGNECSMRGVSPLLRFMLQSPSAVSVDTPRAWKNTHERRRHLLSLFWSRGSLTRAEIVRRLKVAPGTVTTDLKHLIEAGHVRRVSPSSSSRSDFFEIVAD